MNKVFYKFFCAVSFITYASLNFSMDPRHPIIEFGSSGNSQNNNNNDSHSSLKDVHDRTIHEHLSKGTSQGSHRHSNSSIHDDSNSNFYDQFNEDKSEPQQSHLSIVGEGGCFGYLDEDGKLWVAGSDKSKQSDSPEKENDESGSTPSIWATEWKSSLTYPLQTNTTGSIEIDESEFENLPQISSSDRAFSGPTPYSQSASRAAYHGHSFKPANIPEKISKHSPRREFREQESFSGLDNIPWRDYEGERRIAEEKEQQRRAQTYNRINSFLKDENIPDRYKERLNEVIAGNIQGEVDFNQIEERFYGIQKDYKGMVLHNLRAQETLSSEQLGLRRQLEYEFLSPEDRSLISEEHKKIVKLARLKSRGFAL